MAKEIKITKKAARRGDDGYKIVSVRMRDEMIARLDALSSETNRSRNELINLLLDAALDIVQIENRKNTGRCNNTASGVLHPNLTVFFIPRRPASAWLQQWLFPAQQEAHLHSAGMHR